MPANPDKAKETTKNIDTLIKARWILPVVPQGKILEHCSVAIKHNAIVAIVPSDHASDQFNAKEVIELPNHVLTPGFINAHGHAAMSLLRGYADDLPLHTWLEQHIWPVEQQWVSPQFVADGTELAIAEMIAGGITCFSDMYFFPEETAKLAHKHGIRAQITFPVFDFPTAWAANADEYIHKGLALHDSYRSIESIRVGFGPHAPYTVSDAPFQRIVTLADELQAPIHVHLHETAEEVTTSLQTYKKRPIERLAELGVLTPLTQCVHMTQITAEDVSLMHTYGASVVHCPQSNLKLASGLCPVQHFLDAEVSVALGTDGAASNNGLNMLAEINVAALVAKIAANDATAVNAHTALYMATLGGAKVLGIDDTLGSIEVGKKADLTAIELTGAGSLPQFDVASHLVYNNRNAHVTHTWVNGHCLFNQGVHTQLDLAAVHAHAHEWQLKIKPQQK